MSHVFQVCQHTSRVCRRSLRTLILQPTEVQFFLTGRAIRHGNVFRGIILPRVGIFWHRPRYGTYPLPFPVSPDPDHDSNEVEQRGIAALIHQHF